VPGDIFGYGSILFRCLLDEGGEVATAIVLHEDVKNASVSVDVSVVVSHNVVVMKVLKNISTHSLLSVGEEVTRVSQDTRSRHDLLSISLAHPLRVLRENICENGREPENTKVPPMAHTKPSVFRRTLRIIAKEPFPITSRGS